MDINPLLATEKAVVAVDARIKIREIRLFFHSLGRIFYFSIVISPTFGKLNKRSDYKPNI